MLVLMRKSGQSLLIGKDIEIHILETHQGMVKIGINAPKEITILRKELLSELKSVNEESVVKSAKITLEEISDIIKNSPKI